MSKASLCGCGYGFFSPVRQIMCDSCLYDEENHYRLMTCAVCNGLDYSYNLNINHHVSYFPEQIIKIHRKCHTRPKLKRADLIQYTNAEYKLFYKNKRPLIIKLSYKQPKGKEIGKLYHSKYNDNTYKGYF